MSEGEEKGVCMDLTLQAGGGFKRARAWAVAGVSAMLSLAVGGKSASALIVNGGTTGHENNTAPAGLTNAWNAVGANGGASGVYLGNRWAITAYHAGAGELGLPSTGSIPTVPGSSIRLQDPVTHELTDLVLYRLQSDPGLPLTPLVTHAPTYGTPVTMIAYGDVRSGGPVYYNVDTTDPDNWVWTSGTAASYDLMGYTTGGRAGHLWAKSFIDYYDPQTHEVQGFGVADPSLGPVRVITTVFDDLPNSGMGASGDSGGGLFNDQGELIGIFDLIGTYPNQPANTALYTDVTYFLDLSAYLPQINAITGRLPVVPEPGVLGFAVPAAMLLGRRKRG